MVALNHLIDFPKPPAKPAKASARPALSSWSGERVDYLIALWAEGFGKTCPEIASFLNERTSGKPLSASAIAGKITRLDLPEKDLLIRRDQIRDAREKRRLASGKVTSARKHVKTEGRIVLREKRRPLPKLHDSHDLHDFDVSLCVSFAQHDNQKCRYVVGEPTDLLFCGRERDGESPWCAEHRKRCTRPRS